MWIPDWSRQRGRGRWLGLGLEKAVGTTDCTNHTDKQRVGLRSPHTSKVSALPRVKPPFHPRRVRAPGLQIQAHPPIRGMLCTWLITKERVLASLCVLSEAGVRNPFAKGAGRRIAGGRVCPYSVHPVENPLAWPAVVG